MTILEPNQPWPQVYFRRYKYSSGASGYYEEGYEDESIVDIIIRAKDKYYYENLSSLKTLFAGPRAWYKIQNLMSRNNYIVTKTQDLSQNIKKEFLGMQLILTIDDGLWVA